MLKKLNLHSDAMGIAIILWFCSLPLIAFVVLPLFGRTVALSTALALLVASLVLCWGLCLDHVVEGHRRDRRASVNKRLNRPESSPGRK